MFAALLKTEFTKYGRSSWFPVVTIFYDAILAFATVLLMYFKSTSAEDIYYYSNSLDKNQFLVISSIEVISTLLLVPAIVSIMFGNDKEHYIEEQLAFIPGACARFTFTKFFVAVSLNFIVFLSGMPILMVSCIYSDISFLEMLRLAGIIIVFSFWSASITILFHTFLHNGAVPIAGSLLVQIVLSMGIVFVISMTGAHYTKLVEANPSHPIPTIVTQLCLVFLITNPFCMYMGFYSNLTGDISIMSQLCGQVGIDSTSPIFSMLFYKTAVLGIIFMAAVFILAAGWYESKTCIKHQKVLS